jgi:hypothetical protein
MVFDASETYLYSADLRGNKVWTHKKDSETGLLTLVGCVEAPDPLDHPRWVAIHPSGAYLYVLMEAGNRLAVYVIDEQSHCPVFTHITYPLIPPGMLKLEPWVVLISNSNRNPKSWRKALPIRCGLPISKREISLRNLSCQQI